MNRHSIPSSAVALLRTGAIALALSSMAAHAQPQAGTQQPQKTTQPQSQQPTTGATAGTASSMQTTKADRTFMQEAAAGGMAEVELGKMAQGKASNQMVKQFASRIVEDHGKVNSELKQIAATKGVQLPAEPAKHHQKDADRLGKLSGAQFDREFMAHMVADHQKDIDAFTKASKSNDGEIQAFASKTLPTLQEHMKMAKSTQDTVKAGK